MKITKTNNELLTFINVLGRFMQVEKDTKLAKKMGKQSKVIFSCLEDYESKMEDHRLDLCSVDEKNNIVYERRQGPNGEIKDYCFTPANLKKLTDKSRALGKESVELEWFLTPEDLATAKDTSFANYFAEFAGLEDAIEPLMTARNITQTFEEVAAKRAELQRM